MSKAKTKRAAGYIRVSKVGGRKGDSFQSPAEQRAAIEALAAERGVEVASWHEELDASGGNDGRPGWNEARGAVARGEVAVVMVYDFARWSRDTEQGLASVRLIQEAGGDIWSCMERIDTTTPDGWFMVTSFLANATLQRAVAGRRFRGAAEGAVSRGVYTAGTIPIGYVRGEDKRLIPEPMTAPVVVGASRGGRRASRGRSWHDGSGSRATRAPSPGRRR